MSLGLESIISILTASRCIVHIDLDCFYCQVEQVRLGISSDIPLAVRQWNGLIAVNYAARRCGVQRHISPTEARRLCPDIQLIHVPTLALDAAADEETYHTNPDKATHKSSLAPYRRASTEIMQVLQSFTPNLQKASVDEAYLDITEIVNSALIKELVENPREPTQLVWENVAALPTEYESSALEILNDPHQYWKQRQLHQGGILVSQIRQAVFDKLGYTCSAGIAHNKLLAKIGSALHKPNQQTVFPEAEVEGFLADFPLSKVPGLGGKLGEKIMSSFGDTVGSIRNQTLEALKAELGVETADFLFNMARGIHHDQVVPVSATKSMMAAKSLQPLVTQPGQLEKWLQVLSSELIGRLLTSDVKPERWPRTITFTYFNPGSKENQGKSKTGTMPPYPVVQSDPSALWKQAYQLSKSCMPGLYPCSRLAISVGNIENLDLTSRSILNFFKVTTREDKEYVKTSKAQHSENPERTINLGKADPANSKHAIIDGVKPDPIIIDLDSDSDESPQLDQSTNHESNVLEKTESCLQCGLSVPIKNMPDHKDYHLATKLQRDLDLEASKKPTSVKKINNKRPAPKSSPPSKKPSNTIHSFFKPKPS